MSAHNNKKSYKIEIFPYLIGGRQFYKLLICDIDWIDIEKESYDASVRDIFVFPNLRTAVEAMANYCADGSYPEE